MRHSGKSLAILLAIAMLVGLAACGGTEPEPPEPTEEITTAIATQVPETTTAEPETTSEPAETTTEPDSTTEASETTDMGTTVQAPTTVQHALNGKEAFDLLNAAIKNAVDSKAGYTKHRFTKITDLDFGVFSRIPGLKEVVADAVYGFFDVGDNGEGIYEKTVAKGKSSNYLRNGVWTMDDITGAKAEPDGKGGWNLTVDVKSGSTRWSGNGRADPGSGVGASSVDRAFLYYSETDSVDVDHKTAKNLYYTINHAESDFGKPHTKDIQETTTNVVVTAKIDANGRLTNLTGRMDMMVDIFHVNFVITLRNKTGKGYGVVEYKDFKY